MRKFMTKVNVHYFKVISSLALLVSILNMNRVCFACFHQPKAPKELEKYRKH